MAPASKAALLNIHYYYYYYDLLWTIKKLICLNNAFNATISRKIFERRTWAKRTKSDEAKTKRMKHPLDITRSEFQPWC